MVKRSRCKETGFFYFYPFYDQPDLQIQGCAPSDTAWEPVNEFPFFMDSGVFGFN